MWLVETRWLVYLVTCDRVKDVVPNMSAQHLRTLCPTSSSVEGLGQGDNVTILVHWGFELGYGEIESVAGT